MSYTHVIYHAIYEGERYSSIKQEYEDVKDQLMHLSEHGTNGLKALKIPVTENRFIIFSEEQIKRTLVEVELLNEKPVRKSKKNVDMIKS